MKYIYYITYLFKQKYGFGTGMVQLIRNKEIDRFEEIIEIKENIENKNNIEAVTIINYKLLRKEES